MTDHRVELQAAYILHSRPFRETSLLVDCFSRDFGRVSFVARGARAARSRWRCSLQLFRPLLLSWAGRSDLKTLTAAEPSGTLASLTGKALYCGLYMNELLMRSLAQQDPHADLFAVYHASLLALINGGGLHPPLRQFEIQLLAAIGLGIQLDRDTYSDQPIAADGWYQYKIDQGLVRTGSGGRSGAAVSGKLLKALAAGDYSNPKHQTGMRLLLQSILKHHLGDKPLASQALLRSLEG